MESSKNLHLRFLLFKLLKLLFEVKFHNLKFNGFLIWLFSELYTIVDLRTNCTQVLSSIISSRQSVRTDLMKLETFTSWLFNKCQCLNTFCSIRLKWVFQLFITSFQCYWKEGSGCIIVFKRELKLEKSSVSKFENFPEWMQIYHKSFFSFHTSALHLKTLRFSLHSFTMFVCRRHSIDLEMNIQV